jgi:YVTN family beta-propeller protein
MKTHTGPTRRAAVVGTASALLAATLLAGCTSKPASSARDDMSSMSAMELPADNAPPATFLTGDSPGASPTVSPSDPATSGGGASSAQPAVTTGPTMTGFGNPLPGMPPVDDPNDLYNHDRPGMLSPVVAGFPNLIYVPNSNSNTVDVIDPTTYKIVEHFAVPAQPQHVVPSYDLKTLWVNSDVGNALTPIDPATGKPGKPVPVEDPYNLYFTPDGASALVMAERLQRIDWRDPHTMALESTTKVPCKGVNHADFSANGRYFIVSCEFDGQLLKIDTATRQVVGHFQLAPHAMPQDVKTSPDGRIFYIADMNSNGVWEIDGDKFAKIGFIPTGKGAHGLYVSRDSKDLYVTNRGEGSISLVDLATRTVRAKWEIPGGGSPDMGGVSADGTQLWVSGRYNGVVYDISTVDGHLIKKIKVGASPHGLCVYPQPGRYSLGHTGVFR